MLEQPLLFTGWSSIQKIASKIVFSKNSNFISLIYSSSESSWELSKSLIICLTTFFSIYLHSFKKPCR